MEFLATTVILLLCMLGLGIGYIITNKPFQKRCASEYNKDCSCEDETKDGVCEKKNGPA